MPRTPASHKSVVIPAVYAPHAVTCLRSLGRRGVHTIGVYERPTPAFGSRYCDETVITPDPAEDIVAYKDALLALVKRDDVRAILPMREADVYVLSKYRDAFAAHVEPLWPPFETLTTVHDRIRLVEAAEAAGVSVPDTRALDDVEDWNREQIVKARYVLLAEEFVRTETPEAVTEPSSVRYLEPGVEPDREEVVAEMGHVPLVQEYVPGDEYAFWALYDRGEPVATCLKHQIRAFSYAGGTSVYRRTVREPALDAAGRALLDHLDWHGFASVQFKRDATTGEFRLLEVNPRVWVSMNCPVRAGLDFPYYYWLLADGRRPPRNPEYEDGIGTHYVGGEVMYLYSVLRDENPFVESPPFGHALLDVAASLYAQPRCDYFSLDDPAPFARDGLNWAMRKGLGGSDSTDQPERPTREFEDVGVDDPPRPHRQPR